MYIVVWLPSVVCCMYTIYISFVCCGCSDVHCSLCVVMCVFVHVYCSLAWFGSDVCLCVLLSAFYSQLLSEDNGSAAEPNNCKKHL